MAQKIRKATLISPFLAFLGFLFYNARNPASIQNCQFYVSYYLILLLCLVSAYSFTKYLPSLSLNFPSTLKGNLRVFLPPLMATILVFVTVPIGYKVMHDETNLIGVSKNMTRDHATYITPIEVWNTQHFDTFPEYKFADKRPLLFPFFIHLLHVFTGYRSENAFVLNFLTLFSILTLVFLLCRKIFDNLTGIAAIFFILSQPIISICATSAGFELFSLLFLALVFLAFYHYLEKPSKHSLWLFWLSCLLVIHTRYECLVYAVILFGLLIVGKRIQFRDVLERWEMYAGSLLFLLPFIWQRFMFKDMGVNHVPMPGSPKKYVVFSIDNFFRHFLETFDKDFLVGTDTPYSILFLLIGATVSALLSIQTFRGKSKIKDLNQYFFLLALVLCIMANFVLFLSHSGGSLIRPTAARYFLGLFLCIALSPLVFKKFIKEISSTTLLLFAIATFLIHHPAAMGNLFLNTLITPLETKVVRNFLKKQDRQTLLLIADAPARYAVDNYNTLNFEVFTQYESYFLGQLKAHRFKNIFVVQMINYKSGLAQEVEVLRPGLKLETVEETQLDSLYYLRISRLDLNPKN